MLFQTSHNSALEHYARLIQARLQATAPVITTGVTGTGFAGGRSVQIATASTCVLLTFHSKQSFWLLDGTSAAGDGKWRPSQCMD